MQTLLEVGLSNAMVATFLAILAAAIGLATRRPAAEHAMWVVVFVKFVSPPLLFIPLAIWSPAEVRQESVRQATMTKELAAPRPHAELSNGDLAMHGISVISTVPQPLLNGSSEQSATPTGEQSQLSTESALFERASSWVNSAVSRVRTILTNRFWLPVVFCVWAAGAMYCLGKAAICLRAFQQLLAHAEMAPPKLQREASLLAARMGLRVPPVVVLVPGTQSPMVWGLGRRPKLLLPKRLLRYLGPEQLQTILVHELAHLRRRDHWVRWLELFCLAAYWWHPVIWWGSRRLRELEEQACDACVVSLLPAARESYATALLDTVDFLAGARPALPPVATGIGHTALLKRRLTMIMQGTSSGRLSLPGRMAIAGTCVALLPWTLTFTRGQERDKESRDASRQRPPAAAEGEGETANAQRMRLLNKIGKLIVDGKAEEARKLAEQVRDVEQKQQEAAQRESQKAARDLDRQRDSADKTDRGREKSSADEASQEFQKQLRQELRQADEEIKQARNEVREAMAGIREQIRDAIQDAPEVAGKLLEELNLQAIIDDAMKSAPDVLKKTVAEMKIDETVRHAIEDANRRSRANPSRDQGKNEDKEKIRRELDKDLREAAQEVSAEAKKSVDDVRVEIAKVMKEASQSIQRADLQKVIEREVQNASESVRQIIRDVDVDQIVNRAVNESVDVAEKARIDAIRLSGDALERGKEAVRRAEEQAIRQRDEGQRMRAESREKQQEQAQRQRDQEAERAQRQRDEARQRAQEARDREQAVRQREREARQREQEARQREQQQSREQDARQREQEARQPEQQPSREQDAGQRPQAERRETRPDAGALRQRVSRIESEIGKLLEELKTLKADLDND